MSSYVPKKYEFMFQVYTKSSARILAIISNYFPKMFKDGAIAKNIEMNWKHSFKKNQ